MKVLVVGCGAVGGYFGGRLAASGVDVTFLVRPARQQQLKQHGLKIQSPRGDVQISVASCTIDQPLPAADVVLLCCKAYDLTACLQVLAQSLQPNCLVLPLLNGLAHYAQLQTALPHAQLLAGYCNISAVLGENGEVRHLNQIHELTLGRYQASTESAAESVQRQYLQLLTTLKQGGFVVRDSHNIVQELWEKFVFINTLAGATCLLQGDIGQINQTTQGQQVIQRLLAECQDVAAACGFAVSRRADKLAKDAFLNPLSRFSASMYKDMQANRQIEADALFGEMLRRANAQNIDVPLLTAAYSRAAVYLQQTQPIYQTMNI